MTSSDASSKQDNIRSMSASVSVVSVRREKD